MKTTGRVSRCDRGAGVSACWHRGGVAAGRPAPESKRLARAKDFIADEQWARADRGAAGGGRRPEGDAPDEALYWLAHSLNQAGDAAAAVPRSARSSGSYPSSLWVKPAGSLRIEIAVRLSRNDVLWWTAVAAAAAAAGAGRARRLAGRRRRAATSVAAAACAGRRPGPRARRYRRRPPPPPADAAGPPAARTAGTARPPPMWFPEFYQPDTDLRIQALGSLMQTDAAR